MQRRDFLSHAGALAGTAALGQLGLLAARAATTQSDYKALVCIFLAGGNDSNNMIVPIDTAGYANYAAVRANLALPQAQLLPIAEAGGALNYGLHPALPGLQSLWTAGNLAVVANVGTLVQPLTKTQYQSTTTQKPATLFSHIDQQHEWQASVSNAPSTTGWGGRLAEQLSSLNVNSSIGSMISTGGNNLFVTGAASQALVIPTSGSFGLSGFGSSSADAARRAALVQLLGMDQGADLVSAAQGVVNTALSSSAVLNPILTASNSSVAQYFSALTANGLAQQLLAIAKVIEARSALGAQRQIFLATLGSFDTHTDQINTQQTLFAQMDPAITAFQNAMAALGTLNNVTSFMISDFSRTFSPNTGGGSDHAWGSHHLAFGGAVHGGKIYGTLPTLALGGPSDEGTLGRWLPNYAVDQYAATLATWFGADSSALAAVLPNLAAFTPGNLGFI
jgi:uncharacterized protein (DUF1501 family)